MHAWVTSLDPSNLLLPLTCHLPRNSASAPKRSDRYASRWSASALLASLVCATAADDLVSPLAVDQRRLMGVGRPLREARAPSPGNIRLSAATNLLQ
jgi:hypothetical protein